MPKIKKLKRKKKFRANVNRKRLRNKLRKLPNIECKQIKDAWEVKQSTVQNLVQMGLAYDPNQVLKIPKIRNEMLKVIRDGEEEFESASENVEENVTKKLHVVQCLEEEAKHPRAKLFRLPTNEVHFATYMMDKYGEDYKAMVRDRKNYNQLTWRQIKAKIERFKRIPEQYAEYLVKKGEIVLEDPAPLKKLKPEILRETVEKKPNAKPSRRKRQKSSIVESIWQEESVIQNESMNDDSINATTDNDDDLSSTNQSNREKKLQLFSDDEADDDDNDDVLMEEDDSASENKSNIKGKLENEKKNVLLRKSTNLQQKN